MLSTGSRDRPAAARIQRKVLHPPELATDLAGAQRAGSPALGRAIRGLTHIRNHGFRSRGVPLLIVTASSSRDHLGVDVEAQLRRRDLGVAPAVGDHEFPIGLLDHAHRCAAGIGDRLDRHQSDGARG